MVPGDKVEIFAGKNGNAVTTVTAVDGGTLEIEGATAGGRAGGKKA